MISSMQLLNDIATVGELAAWVVRFACRICQTFQQRTVIDKTRLIKEPWTLESPSQVLHNDEPNLIECPFCGRQHYQYIHITPDTVDENGHVICAALHVTEHILCGDNLIKVIGYVETAGGGKLPLLDVRAYDDQLVKGARQRVATRPIRWPAESQPSANFVLPIDLNRLASFGSSKLPDQNPKFVLELTTPSGTTLDRAPEGIDLFQLHQYFLENHMNMLIQINAALAGILHYTFQTQRMSTEKFDCLFDLYRLRTAMLEAILLEQCPHPLRARIAEIEREIRELEIKLDSLRREQAEQQRAIFPIMLDATRCLLEHGKFQH